jgi:hypothetical protein
LERETPFLPVREVCNRLMNMVPLFSADQTTATGVDVELSFRVIEILERVRKT